MSAPGRACGNWRLHFLAVLFISTARMSHADLAIDWVTVGNPGNAPDKNGRGSVPYTYRISKYEITNGQYVGFLNAVARTGDTFGLFKADMERDPRGGIVRLGEPDDYVYDAKPFMRDKPVSFVSFYDAIRFANWLHNDQPEGPQDATTTEDGAYTITPDGILNNSITRNPAAQVFLPSGDEWYKAAFFEPGAVTEDGNQYWRFATRSDSLPEMAHANPAGNIRNPGKNVANYRRGADWNGQDGNVTTVGGAGRASESYYAVADMNGNLSEWTEEILATFRGIGGGLWRSATLAVTFPGLGDPRDATDSVGFRVASFSGTGRRPGDFNGNGTLDVADVQALSDAIARRSQDMTYDVDRSSKIDTGDLLTWVRSLRRTWVGDTDLDGRFDSSDLVRVFQAGRFERNVNASWEQGDWNADRRANTSDFVLAFQDDGFEKGVRTTAVVPEPAGGLLLVLGILCAPVRRRIASARAHRPRQQA